MKHTDNSKTFDITFRVKEWDFHMSNLFVQSVIETHKIEDFLERTIIIEVQPPAEDLLT